MKRNTAIALGLGGAAGVLGAVAAAAGSRAGGIVSPGPGPGPAPGVPQLPVGKGVTIRRNLAQEGTPAQVLAKVQGLGCTWVAIVVFWGKPTKLQTYGLEKLHTYTRPLQDAGIDVWFQGWPRPESIYLRPQVEIAAWACNALGGVGFKWNAERPFYPGFSDAGMQPAQLAESAEYLVASFKSEAPAKFQMLSSYAGGKSHHPRFPWRAWRGVDSGMPQIFDTKHTKGPDFPVRSMRNWAEGLGFGPAVVPIWGGSSGNTPAQMRQMVDWTPLVRPAGAWWSLDHLTKNSARYAAVAGIQLRGRQLYTFT